MIVRLQERTPRCPSLVNGSNPVPWIGSQFRIEVGNRHVSNFQLLPVFFSYAFNILLNG